MPIVPANLLWRYSNPAASAGNTTTQGSPAASLGAFISTTAWAGNIVADLFSDVTPSQGAAGTPTYRAVFLFNSHSTRTLKNAVAWIESQTVGGATLALGVDPTAASPVSSLSVQALSVAQTTTAPTGVTFSAPATPATGVSLGDVAPGYCRCLWLKLTPGDAAAVNSDSAVVKVRGQTYA